MMKTDKIAILIATYNGEGYLEAQLNSLLEQTNQDWVAYLHDDGSKDATAAVIKRYCENDPDHFVSLDAPAAGGAKYNFFFLFEQVEAPFYMTCDQDDVWLANKIEVTLEKMKEGYEETVPKLVYTDLKVVDNDLKVLSESMNTYQMLECEKVSLNKLLIQNVVTGCTMMVNKALRDMLIQVGNKDNIVMHDWWAALIAAAFGKIVYLPEATICYRQHGDNSVGVKKTLSFRYLSIFLSRGKIQKALERTRRQAGELLSVFQTENEHTGLIREYAVLHTKGKLYRLKFYTKHKIMKSSFIRNIGLILYG